MSVGKYHAEVEGDSWRAGDKPFVEGLVVNDRSDEARRRAYRPQDFPLLPNALSKVKDERSALDFVRKWGLLGYSELLLSTLRLFDESAEGDEDKERAVRAEVDQLAGGDPLPWFLAQAKSVRFATELVEALQIDRPGAVGLVLAIHQTEWRPAEFAGASGASLRFTLARGLEVRSREYTELDSPRMAMRIVEDLVASNTRTVRRILLPGSSGNRLRWTTNMSALSEIVWSHVGDWADHGLVKLCELETCRTPFLVTDGRQRFCPADEEGGKSRCAGLYQKRQQRRSG